MKIILISILALSFKTWAFPELIRYQYNNCTACHVSPSGAGLLTNYGRSLSVEVLSTWGTPNEAGFLHHKLNLEKEIPSATNEISQNLKDIILFGGDIRAVQVHRENENVKSGRFIKMQADVSVGLVTDRWAIVSNIGELEEEHWNPYSTSYYGMWKPFDELSIRIGKFTPQYGLYIMDHIAFIKSSLGFGMESARNSIESQWTGEQITANMSASKEVRDQNDESALSVQAQYFFLEKYKIAINLWDGHASSYKRNILGAWGLFGFTQNVFLISEIDQQSKTSDGSNVVSIVGYNKFGYTLLKGLDLFLVNELSKSDVSDSSTEITRTGLGVQFYPRPHFEVSGTWNKQKSMLLKQEEDYAWILLHYYL